MKKIISWKKWGRWICELVFCLEPPKTVLKDTNKLNYAHRKEARADIGDSAKNPQKVDIARQVLFILVFLVYIYV